ncbi:MAG: hypothetical protein OK422_06275 [Thaumarchaeota archaeon]|nr:hypothetical protein [Nitrososphaerota archaeon]
MLSPPLLILFLLNVLSAIVALIISYYAFRFNRLVDSNVLRAISIGFMLLGISLSTEALTSVIAGQTIVEAFIAPRILQADEGVLFLVMQIAAYLTFAWGYTTGAFGKQKSSLVQSSAVLLLAAAARPLTTYYDATVFFYLATVVLLAFVVFQGILIYARSKNRSPLLVLLGFGLILLGHVFMLDAVVALAPSPFYEGTAIQFVGFLSLLWFLVRSGRIGPT